MRDGSALLEGDAWLAHRMAERTIVPQSGLPSIGGSSFASAPGAPQSS